MKYLSFCITILVLLYSCKEFQHQTDNTQKAITQIDSATNITNNNQDGVAFLTEFYKKYYGEFRDKKGIKNYISYRVLSRIDSLTKCDNLILDYDPFISGQDWDEKVLKESLEIKALESSNTFRVSFFKFNKNNEERTNIDIMLEKSVQGKFLISSILDDEHLNFKKKIDYNKTKTIGESNSITTKQYDYDLDVDGITDKIILYQNFNAKGEFERNHFGLPMIIKKGLPNNTFQTWYENDDIIPKSNFNCATEGFLDVVFKDNYFTIENQICSSYIEILSYTTFKVIENKIVLHKYGQTYFDKADHDKRIPSITWTQKDFNKINFEDVTDDFLIKLSQTTPKK